MRTISGISGLLLLIFTQCSAPKEKIPPPPAIQPGGNKLVIYEMLPRLFGNLNEVNKPFATLEENGVGKLEDITDLAIIGIKELGVTHIQLLGVLEHSTMTDYTTYGIPLDDPDVVKGRAGFPGAVKDYYDIDPDLAIDIKNRVLEFERLIDRIHRNSLKVIIGLMPNQVARTYASNAKPEGVEDFGVADDKTKAFDRDNNFYYLPGQPFQVPKAVNVQAPNLFPARDGKFEESPAKVSANNVFMPAINDAFDAVNLNYGVDFGNNQKKYFDSIPDTWSKMRDILVFWARKKVDGFQCELQSVPIEFWRWVIPQVKAINPEIIFIGRKDKPTEYVNTINVGRFDFLMDKVKSYDTLRLLINNKASTTDISRIQKSLAGINQNMVHFLEHHDDVRIGSTFFNPDSSKALPGMVMSATIDKGPVMIYFGQEVGESAAGAEGYSSDDGKTTLNDYWGMPEFQKWVNGKKYDGGQLSERQKVLRKFYVDLLSLARNNPAVSKGEYIDLTESNVTAKNFSNRISAFARVFEDEKIVVITSFNSKPEHIKVLLSPEAISAMKLETTKMYVGNDEFGLAGRIEILEGYYLEMDMPAYGYAILKVN